MNKIRKLVVLYFVVLSLIVSGCGPEQAFGPTVTPLPTSTNTPMPASTNTPMPTTTSSSAYLDLRKSYSTVLKSRGPAPQTWRNALLSKGITEVSYSSGSLKLKAWLAMPPDAQTPVPAVVYFHGGFSFDWTEFRNCQPFLDAGYAVMIPTFRAENGNPGNFELFYGEVEDARAAILWLADQPTINKSRIYTFGHSVGGGISALLSLWDDIPVRMGGSSGGLYPNYVFNILKDIVPFDMSIEKEISLRLLIGNIKYMKRQHIAYMGQKDDLVGVVPAFEAEKEKWNAPLIVKIVEGDHGTSLAVAVLAFTEVIKSDK
jgi:hypothetical protein